jgi:DNA-damage-inducible protein J
MTTSALNLRIENEEKKRFVSLTKQIGLTPSDAVRVFIHRFNHDQGFPFPVNVRYAPMSSDEIDEMAQIEAAIEAGKAQTFSSWKELKQNILNDEEI